ncbi:MAG: 2-oxoacid:acceptor oxidoreductase subunit alpha [Candidatus Thorarchaeota archaeon]|nr:2-oxoacid:acceptor oxidoreductase subunit alpha [Candidatus Thorarchaeota archaeon]
MDITLQVGGEAGQGINTVGDLLAQVFVKAGFYTFTINDAESRIRGGYNFTQIRVSDTPIHAPVDDLDVIIAFSQDAIVNPRSKLADHGVIIFDDSVEFENLEECHYRAPLQKTAKEVGGNTRMTNAAAVGAVLAILRFPLGLAEETLASIFKKKGENVISSNVAVLRAMHDRTLQEFGGPCSQNLSTTTKGPGAHSMLMTGNLAMALGAVAANLKWISSYPMSPSTSLFQDVISFSRELNIGAIQTEDELASINMALGASFAGARSMVTTSGGGFSLMAEALGLGAMAEVPIVIYNAQRAGPSTGLPTRTEQSDLLFMAFASQGEFPRIMLAPKNPMESFDVAKRAFDLADRFQVPVMILGDQHLADSTWSTQAIDVTKTKVDRGVLAGKANGVYQRYKLTDDGVSPRAFPGDPGKVVVSSGNVHLENGHITEDPKIRNAMVEKFLKKIPHILDSLDPPNIYGPDDADVMLLTWGSTWGATYEAVSKLNYDGIAISQLHFCDIYPLRTDRLTKMFDRVEKVVAVEQNTTSQFAKLVRMETGLDVTHHINKFDGRPMTPRWVIQQLEEVGAL